MLHIFALGPCTGERCKLGEQDTITVNGIDGLPLTPEGFTKPQNAIGYGGQYRATLQFFGTADKNTGALRNVAIDWGDGTRPIFSREGRYKNHLGLCDADDADDPGRTCTDGGSQCDNSDFAHSDDACTDQYFNFTHTYSCPVGGAGKRSCDDPLTDSNCYARDSCPVETNGAIPGFGSCCIYKPKVQLKDNWGWCNGSCPGAPGGDGCYDDSEGDTSTNECRSANIGNASTPFAGRVIVVPK